MSREFASDPASCCRGVAACNGGSVTDVPRHGPTLIEDQTCAHAEEGCTRNAEVCLCGGNRGGGGGAAPAAYVDANKTATSFESRDIFGDIAKAFRKNLREVVSGCAWVCARNGP